MPPIRQKPNPHYINRVKQMAAKGYGVQDISSTVPVSRRDIRIILGLLKPRKPPKPRRTLAEEAEELLARGFDPAIVRANFGEHCPT